MTHEDLIKILGGLSRRGGASSSAFYSLRLWSGVQLPQSYIDFLRLTNGAEGFASESVYLNLYPAEQIAELNEGYAISEFAPGLLLIGSDGGGTAYALDTRHESMPVRDMPFIRIYQYDIRTAGSDFEDFLIRASKGDIPF